MTRPSDQSRSHVHPLTRLMRASRARRPLAGMALAAVSARVGAAHIDGMSSLVGLLPQEKIEVVVLTNMNGSLLPSVMAHRVFDDQLELPPTDFSGEMRTRADALEKKAKEAAAKVEATGRSR